MVTISSENVDNIKEVKDTEFGFNGKSGVIRDENVIVGFYNIYIDEPEITLEELEILDKFRFSGYGTQFLKALFDKYPECDEIVGNALEDSIGFYENLNAEFSDTCSSCSITSCECHPEVNVGNISQRQCDECSENLFRIRKEEFLSIMEQG
jgi:hypothetical protein